MKANKRDQISLFSTIIVNILSHIESARVGCG